MTEAVRNTWGDNEYEHKTREATATSAWWASTIQIGKNWGRASAELKSQFAQITITSSLTLVTRLRLAVSSQTGILMFVFSIWTVARLLKLFVVPKPSYMLVGLWKVLVLPTLPGVTEDMSPPCPPRHLHQEMFVLNDIWCASLHFLALLTTLTSRDPFVTVHKIKYAEKYSLKNVIFIGSLNGGGPETNSWHVFCTDCVSWWHCAAITGDCCGKF